MQFHVMIKKFVLGILFSIFSIGVLSAQDNPVHWSFSTKKVSDCEYDLVFKAKIDEPWHLYSLNRAGDEGPNPTVFTFKKNTGYELVGKVKQEKPLKEFDKVFEMNVEYYKHEATFTQRIKLLSSSKTKISGKYEFQACTEEKCIFPPADKFDFELEGSPSCGGAASAAVATDSVPSDTAETLTTETSVTDTSTLSKSTSVVAETHYENEKPAATSMSWIAIFLAGFVGGFAALLTPCVFPMIPMNVSFFTKQSKSKKQGLRNALIYALFIIVLYVGLGLGVTLIFGAGALHSLSTNVWFNLAFFLLLLIFAASFLGAFEIVLPSAFVNKMDAKADKGGMIGIFFMAFTLAPVSYTHLLDANTVVIAAVKVVFPWST